MPSIIVSVPKGGWTKEEKSAIVTELTKTLAEVGKKSGKGDITAYINAQVREAAEGGYAVGGNVVG
ncbi:MAG: tautomerase family protein [Chloroflexota bacterium]